jgi:hypothetical protein
MTCFIGTSLRYTMALYVSYIIEAYLLRVNFDYMSIIGASDQIVFFSYT